MNDKDSLPDSVSVYYNAAVWKFALIIGLGGMVTVGALVTIWGQSKWNYLLLAVPMTILVLTAVGYKKLFRYTEIAKNSIPYIKIDRDALALVGVSIPWTYVRSIEILKIPTRSGSLKYFAVTINKDIKSFRMRTEQLELLTQNNRSLVTKFRLDGINLLSLGAVDYLTLSVDKIDSVANAFLNAATYLRNGDRDFAH